MRRNRFRLSNPLFPLMATTAAGVVGVLLSLAGHLASPELDTRHLGTSAIAMTAEGDALNDIQTVTYNGGDGALFHHALVEPGAGPERSLSKKAKEILEGSEPLSDVTILTLDELSRAELDRLGIDIERGEGKVYVITCPQRSPVQTGKIPTTAASPGSCFLIKS